MYISVVIPTYNRQPILQKCLQALENQQLSPEIAGYEVVVVDDGSTDTSYSWFCHHQSQLPHVVWYQQNHQGPAAARNLGVRQAQGDILIFIDSDLLVTPTFLQSHSQALLAASRQQNQTPQTAPIFTYGRVINTCNFHNPTAEPYKITDFSAAYFATGNVAIAKHWIQKAGWFDTRFQLYGWEDLELGVRLKKLGLQLIKCPAAVGYHWHPPFSVTQLPALVEKEIQRGRMGVLFYQKHPTWEVRLAIQMTWLHWILWGLLSCGGLLNERTMAPFLQWLIDRDRPQLAWEVSRIFLNWYNVKAVYAAYREYLRSC